MHRLFFIIHFTLLLFATMGQAQNMTIIVVDSLTKEPLPYASFFTDDKRNGYASEEGVINLKVTKNYQEEVLVQINYVGYKLKPIAINSYSSVSLFTVELVPKSDLPKIIVTSPKDIFNGSLSILSPDITSLERVPLIGGEVDLLKAIQLYPGISGETEGTAGLNVRGGNASQTHLIIDGNTIYNANHIGGFISSLPSFGVKNMTIYKGGMPADYGGRLSGILDVQLRDGRKDKVFKKITIGTGLLRAGLEGPLNKSWSYLVNGRIAYPNLIAQVLRVGSYQRNKSGTFEAFNLRDGIAKVTRKSDRLKLSTSVFHSGDSGFSQDDTNPNDFAYEDFSWSTTSLAQRLRYLPSARMVIKGGLSFTNYGYNYFSRSETTNGSGISLSEEWNEINASLRDAGADIKVDYSLTPDVHISAGMEYKQHQFNHDQERFFDQQEEIQDTTALDQSSSTYAGFVRFRLSSSNDKINIDAGLRHAALLNPSHQYLEPRIKVGIAPSKYWRFNFGFDANTQFVHRLAADQTLFPNELWLIANNTWKPSQSRQVFAGFTKFFQNSGLFFSLEAYYKELKELTESDPLQTSSVTTNVNFVQSALSNGRGRTKGIETYLEWKENRFDLSLAYTLSSSERQFPQLNESEWFPFTFDRRHDISVQLFFSLPKKWTVGGTFVHQTGRALTAPIALTTDYGIYGDINNARFPPFHRLNLSVTKSWKGKRKPNYEHQLSFSLYNAYNRRNLYALRLEPIREYSEPGPNGERRLERVSIVANGRTLFPFMIPGISYSLSFLGK